MKIVLLSTPETLSPLSIVYDSSTASQGFFGWYITSASSILWEDSRHTYDINPGSSKLKAMPCWLLSNVSITTSPTGTWTHHHQTKNTLQIHQQ
jgi:hypothetical protein